MVSARNYGASNIVSHTRHHYRRIPSNQTGDLTKRVDLNKSVNNSELPKHVHSDVPDLRINSDTKTCKNSSEVFTVYNSHLQGESFIATDTESESITITVDCIKVEEDPLQIENDDTKSDINTLQAFSDSISCGALPSGLVSVQLSRDKNCDFLGNTSDVSSSDSPCHTVQCRKSKKASAKPLVAVNSLRKKCGESSLSEEKESDADGIQVSTSTKFQNSIINVARNSELDDHRKEGGRYFVCCMEGELIRNCVVQFYNLVTSYTCFDIITCGLTGLST
jgi:hypothetical protein